MQYRQLDKFECHCGSGKFFIENAITRRVVGQDRVETVQCAEWCGFRQRSVSDGGIGPVDCQECQNVLLEKGEISCRCGRSWKIRDGLPKFSKKTVAENIDGQFRIVETDPTQDPRWNSFVTAHPHGTIYHHSCWLEALQREFKQERLTLAAEDQAGNIHGILPLLYTRGLPFGIKRVGDQAIGRRLSSLPRTPIGGPLSLAPSTMSALLEEALQRVRHERGVQLQIKTYAHDLANHAGDLVCAPWRLSYIAQLPAPGEAFRIADRRHRADIKSALNRATASSVQVRSAGTHSDLLNWYTLYLATMRRLVLPPRPFRFFSALWEQLADRKMIQLLLAEQHRDGRIQLLAGSLFFSFGSTMTYAFSASQQGELRLRPNDLVMWHAITDACSRGFSDVDLGEVPNGNNRLAHFKSKWGARPVQLYRYYYPPRQETTSGSVEEAGFFRRVVNTVWQRLPLRVTSLVGDWVYSYL